MAGFTFIASEKIRKKLIEKHGVTLAEVKQCFYNRTAGFLEDDRENHKTDPPTQWFIATTDKGRKLKVMFCASGLRGTH